MSYFLNLFGSQTNGSREADNAAEVVENLVERVETSSVIEDRRDALKALRSLAKKVRLPVAAIGMNAYMTILEQERNNIEIISIVLEILDAVLRDESIGDEGHDEIGERLSEMIIRKKSFIPSVMSLVELFEFSVRRAAIQLLTDLLRHRASEVQTAIVEEPMGVSRLVDLLHDTREIIRNSTVLMMSELSRAHPQIQQLLAYENTFQILFDIIDAEPIDSIVIEDCLYVILNLLRKNANNQQLFREASLIQRLALLLRSFLFGLGNDEEADQHEYEWQKQKIANVIFLLQIVRSLVSGQDNSQSNTHAAQKAVAHTGMLKNLCSVLLSEIGATVEVLTEAIFTVAEVICGNYTNQEYFAVRSLATDVGNRPALTVLLLSMNTDKQPFKLRCAVFYCFLCYVRDNELGKNKVIDTLLPSSGASEMEITTGQCICSAILSSEAVQIWMGCVCLMHCLFDAVHLKQQLLRVQLTTDSSQPPSSLINHISSVLISLGNRRPQVRAGLLMLLVTWLHNCELAVSQFVAVEENVQYLTTHIDGYGAEGTEDENQVVRGLIAFLLGVCMLSSQAIDDSKKNALCVLVDRRIGKEKLVEFIDSVSHSEHYVRAAQRPQPFAKVPQDLFLDYHFTKFFKNVEGHLVEQICPSAEAQIAGLNSDAVYSSYKDFIKRQDETIATLTQQVRQLEEKMQNQNQALDSDAKSELVSLRKQLAKKCQASEMNDASKEQLKYFKSMASQWHAESQRYQAWAEQWQQYQIAQLPNPQEVVVNQLTMQVKQLEEQLEYGWQAYEAQCTALTAATTELADVKTRLQTLEEVNANLSKLQNGASPNNNAEKELIALKKEQEDLLVLLADQDSKLSEYRRKLRALNQPVTDDEEGDS